MDELRVEIDAGDTLNLAMVENNVPLVARMSITNTTATALEDLAVELVIEPGFSKPWTARISSIPVGGTFNFDDVELPIDRARLVNQLERSNGDLAWSLRGPAGVLASGAKRVEVLAYNEWVRGVPQLLAAFVQPNHPAVAKLLAAARTPLEALTNNPAFEGYQARDPRRVIAFAQAIYEAIQQLGITYSNPPASFEKTGQKIRTPEQVLEEQVGTCLDLTTLIAAALEQVGLNPLLIVLRGHALPGVWLEDHHLPEGISDDPSLVRKSVALGRMLIFDSSAVAKRPALPFAEAVRVGMSELGDEDFRYLVDVHGARALGFVPLTMRVDKEYAAIAVPVAASSGPVGVPRAAMGETSSRRQTPSNRVRNPRVEAWKQRLLDTTLRNRLLNYKDSKKCLQLLCHDLGTVEDTLALGADLTIRPKPGIPEKHDPRSKRLLEARAVEAGNDTFLSDRLAQNELYSEVGAEALDGKLTTIFRGAREALEETGSNPLCLTLGMLDWYESESSDRKLRAPILLMPVTLTRNTRSNTFILRASGDETRLNVTLFEKLRLDRNITLPELDELPLDDAGVDVPKILHIVREAIINQRRWEVSDDLHLGLFSFAKFQMWADLEQNIEAVLDSPVVKHIVFGKGTYPNGGDFVEPRELDARVATKDLLCPLDADASQLAAVVAATEGKTFVLQGPPGTGKSQTITNLIAHGIANGKRILFVAEKSAALDVVHRRLSQIGLAPYVLELHSHKANRQQVLDQLKDALASTVHAEPADWERDTRRLEDDRQQLNAYVSALHQERKSGLSIFDALSRLDALRTAKSFELPAACADTTERFDELKQEVAKLREAVTALAPVGRSPWLGCRIDSWQVDLPGRVREALEQALTRLDAMDAAGRRLAAGLGAQPPTTLAEIDTLCEVAVLLDKAPPHGDALVARWTDADREGRELVALARTRTTALATLQSRYADGLFGLDLEPLATRFRKLARAFWLTAWWGLRAARRTLRSVAKDGRLASRAQVADDLELALTARGAESSLAKQDERGRAIYGAAWRVAESDPVMLESTLAWGASFQRVRSALKLPDDLATRAGQTAAAEDARAQLGRFRTAIDELASLLGWDPRAELERATAPWDALRDRLERWRSDVPRLRHWHVFLTTSRLLDQAGCRALVEAVMAGDLDAQDLPATFERNVVRAWARRELAAEPVLSRFDGETHARQVQSFADRDKAHLAACQAVARARVSQRIPTPSAAAGGEMGFLQREIGKKRSRTAIRKLLKEIPQLVSRLKPCFLMSPMSVAQYLDPKSSSRFDLIVFDEASQIPTHDAIGVLARGNSAVIVGDSKQLPPTSFFDGGGSDETDDENDLVELESILDEAIAAQLPERRLDWHYRSRHESLIAFSNFHYYRNQLNTFPSAAEIGAGRGVSFRQVTGFYDKGGARTNKAEATALVEELLARLRAPDAKRHTFGIVTFSQAQQQLVEDLLDRARQKHPELEGFFDPAASSEPVIVKNLENIQGDERDVMFFSICYGPDQRGITSMNFGPLNRDGGERRLNVAVTRAREELVVFSTLMPDQIDLKRTNAVGVKHLKTFLDYARRGPKAIAEALAVSGGDDFDSPFEEEVCERLRKRGYEVDTQVGCAGYRVDLAIRHPDRPGNYVLGVECDGAYYHSARSARERDRLRQQVLEGLGWTLHRIWSTDWWQEPDGEVAKVIEAIERVKHVVKAEVPAPTPAPPPKQATYAPSAAMTSARAAEPSAPYGKAAPASGLTPYVITSIPVGQRTSDDIHDERHVAELSRVLMTIVKTEAPVSLRVMARRAAPYFGIQRTTARLEERLRQVLERGSSVVIRNDVVWREDQRPEAYDGAREAGPEARREAAEIPVEEVANAALGVLRASISVDLEELVKLTAHALGFSRTGEKVSQCMTEGIELLRARGAARREAEKVILVS